MAWTVIPTIIAGDDITDDFPIATKTAVTELQDAISDASVTWSSPFSSGLTTTSGTTTASYVRSGDIVRAQLRFVFGASSAVTGAIVINLPINSSTINIGLIGTAALQGFYGPVVRSSTSTATVAVWNVAGTYLSQTTLSATVPVTWTTGHTINLDLTYLAAA